MNKIDVSDLLIRVILNRTYYDIPTKQHPFDMEGTVLHILPHDDRPHEWIAQGKLIDILCNTHVDCDMADIMVRWDNDQRSYAYAGGLIFRRGLISICNSLWESSNILIDNRPTEELVADTGGISPKSIEPKYTKALMYSDPSFIPNDGRWHPCYRSKTSEDFGRARVVPGGNIEFIKEGKSNRYYKKNQYEAKYSSRPNYQSIPKQYNNQLEQAVERLTRDRTYKQLSKLADISYSVRCDDLFSEGNIVEEVIEEVGFGTVSLDHSQLETYGVEAIPEPTKGYYKPKYDYYIDTMDMLKNESKFAIGYKDRGIKTTMEKPIIAEFKTTAKHYDACVDIEEDYDFDDDDGV